jgi:hypothetical protein
MGDAKLIRRFCFTPFNGIKKINWKKVTVRRSVQIESTGTRREQIDQLGRRR